MTVRKNTLVLLEEHINTYPKSKIEDIFKFLHQSAFGCEHLVSSFDVALSRIESEKASLLLNTSPFVEKLDGDYSRVSLHYLMNGLKSVQITNQTQQVHKMKENTLSTLNFQEF